MVRDQTLLERVQRRDIKHIPTLCSLSYEERRKQLDMFPLHKRRIKGDMIEVFKILNNIEKANLEIVFKENTGTVTRGNGIKLKVPKCNTTDRKSHFNVRVVEHWNTLQHSVVTFKTIHSFKSRLDWLRGVSFYEIFINVIQ